MMKEIIEKQLKKGKEVIEIKEQKLENKIHIRRNKHRIRCETREINRQLLRSHMKKPKIRYNCLYDLIRRKIKTNSLQMHKEIELREGKERENYWS